ncbi:MAG: ABC transporter substrate-binding protein [archaeon]
MVGKLTIGVMVIAVMGIIALMGLTGNLNGYFMANTVIDNSNESIVIGAILPLSGNAASYGAYLSQGIDLAVEDFAKKGIIVQIIYEDDQYNSAYAVNAFKSLTEQRGVKRIFTFGSPAANAIGPLAAQSEVIYFANATDPKVTQYKNTYRVGADPNQMGELMLKKSIDLNYSRVYVLVSQHEGSKVIAEGFTDILESKNIIIGQEYISTTENDYRSVLAKVKEAKPDAILLEIAPGKIGNAARQVRENGVDIPMFAGLVFEDAAAVKSANGALEGQWYVSSTVSKEFNAKFKSKYNREPILQSADAYIAIEAMVKTAIEAKGSFASEQEIIQEMTVFDTNTLLDGVIVKDKSFVEKAQIKIIQNGQFMVLEGS